MIQLDDTIASEFIQSPFRVTGRLYLNVDVFWWCRHLLLLHMRSDSFPHVAISGSRWRVLHFIRKSHLEYRVKLTELAVCVSRLGLKPKCSCSANRLQMEILLASLGSDRFKLRATDRNEWMRKHTWLFWSSLIVRTIDRSDCDWSRWVVYGNFFGLGWYLPLQFGFPSLTAPKRS